MREYARNRTLILNALPEESSKAQEGLEKLKKKYGSLIRNNRMRNDSDPGRKLAQMQSRLDQMFKLLDLWQRYVDIIYAPEAEIDILIKNRTSKDPHALQQEQNEQSFAAKLQEEEIEKRLAALFQKDVETKEDYESVEEGMTTDTSITTEAEHP